MGEHGDPTKMKLLPLAAVVCGLLAVANCATVVVTGGLGFIGSHVTEELLKDGHKVIIFDDKSNGNNMNKDAHWIFNDISTTDDFREDHRASRLCDSSGRCHFCRREHERPWQVQPNQRRWLEDRVRMGGQEWREAGCHRLVRCCLRRHLSSAKHRDCQIRRCIPLRVHQVRDGSNPAWDGHKGPQIHSTQVLQCLWTSTRPKVSLLWREMVTKGLKSTALRFFNVFGPRQDPKSPYSGVISIFMDRANKGTTMKIFGDGKASRDFIYVKDIAGALIKAMQTDNGGFENFNVCHGEEMTITKLADSIVENFNSKSTIKYEDARAGDIVRSVCNPQKLNTVLGFKPKFSVKDGLAATQQWFADMSKPANTIKEL